MMMHKAFGKKKSMISLLLCMSLLFTCPVYADDTEVPDENTNYEDVILEQTLALDSQNNWNIYDFEIVEINPDGGNISPYSTRNIPVEKALEKREECNGLVTVTTIVPYKITENDELENSFAYADGLDFLKEGTVSSGQLSTIDFTDAVIAFTVIYELDPRSAYHRVMRPQSLDFYWYARGNVSMVYLKVQFGTFGFLCDYPDVLNGGDPADYLVGGNVDNEWYTHSIEREVYNPPANVHYSASKTLPSNQAVVLVKSTPEGHISTVDALATYTVNGNTKVMEGRHHIQEPPI